MHARAQRVDGALGVRDVVGAYRYGVKRLRRQHAGMVRIAARGFQAVTPGKRLGLAVNQVGQRDNFHVRLAQVAFHMGLGNPARPNDADLQLALRVGALLADFLRKTGQHLVSDGHSVSSL